MATKLCLHSGGVEVSREDLGKLSIPKRLTETHFPIPHSDLIDLTAKFLENLGMQITSEQHGISHEGNRYFGLFGLAGNDGASQQDGYELILGLRNSHDRSFRAGLALGSRVFVCDNLAFNAEVCINRKHTRYIMRDLPRLVSIAVNKISGQREAQEKRFARYQETGVTDPLAHDLIIRAIDAGVIGTSKVEKVLREWRKPSHPEFEPRNAWSLFNSFTEVLKEYEGEGAYKRSQPLGGLFDVVCGLAA